jgi:hypothetical protein
VWCDGCREIRLELRLVVIKEIHRVAQAQRISEQAAMYMVNMQQQRTGCSLDQFC